MKRLLLFNLFWAGLALVASAKHIVGGFMSYTYVSGTTYNITLTVYRDCNSSTPFDGVPGSPTPYALVGIFQNGASSPVQLLELTDPVITSIGPPINNPCLQINTSVCVEQGVYTTQITLPSATEGYTVEYERCCRNGTITNLENPGNQGDDFWAYIPPTATYHNNSPVFNTFPPIFICLNSPLVYNNSATDPDGDVLRYSLCTPYNGGSTTNPAPNPPDPPPYATVIWQPPYSDANPLGGVPLTIDSITGELTGTPNTEGQFVVGVCVSEYRGGVLLATYLRDFQFNVTLCNIPIANIPSVGINPTTGIGIFSNQCGSYQINFQNDTYNPPPDSVPIHYVWDFGVPGSTTDTSTQQYPSFTYSDTGSFLVTLIVYKGDSASDCRDTTHAYVDIFPTVFPGFISENVCSGFTVPFTDTSTTTYGFINSHLWQFGDGSTSNQQNPSHLYTAPGTYNVMLVEGTNLGCVDSAYGTVVVYPTPNPNFTLTSPQCINVPITFSDIATGISSYNWSFGDGAGSSQSSSTQTYNTAGTYTVTLAVQSAEGCKDTSSQSVTIHPQPIVTITPDTTICPYTSAQLLATGGVSYQWSPTQNLSDSVIANPLSTPTSLSPITYNVTVTDAFQCTNTASTTISFHPVPHIDAGPDTSVCLNPGSFHDSTQLNATGGVSYVWTPPTGLSATNIANPWARPSGNTTYYVTGTDTNGCKLTDSVTVYYLNPALNLILQNSVGVCEGDTVGATIVNQGSSRYTWNPNRYLTNPASWNTSFYPPDTTNYILTVSNYCYQKSDTLLVAVWPLPQLSVNPLDSVCIGDSIQLIANDAQTFQWSPDSSLSSGTVANPYAEPTVSTLYRVTATSQYGCSNYDSTFIIVYHPSVITISPHVPYICLGNSIELLASGAYSYVWSPAASLSNPFIANPEAFPTDSTQYTVTGTNIHGCKSSDSIIINVQLPVVATAKSPYDECRGRGVLLHASGGFFYSWQPSQGLNDTITSEPYAAPDSTTTYTVIVANECFSDSAKVEVIVHQLPQVDAGNDTTIWRDTYADLNGTSTAQSYYWNPPTWVKDDQSLVTTAAPQQTTLYQLIVTDQYGCQNTDSVLITVIPHIILDLPTGFSPNGDGVNDVFHIVKYLDIDHIENFSVYDRWGLKVFETDNINSGWDGTYMGKPQPKGVYVWMVVAVSQEGERFTQKGNITLIR